MKATGNACARAWVGWLLLGVPLGLPAGEAPSDPQIAGWVKELGAENFQTREEAQKRLQAAGQAALKALQDAAEKTEDAEVRLRAARMVKELTTGPRIAAAVQALDSDDWERVSAALETLWEEWAQGSAAQEGIVASARGSDKRAALAKIFQEQLNQLEKTRESYAKYLEQQLNNEQARQQIARALEVTEQRTKAQILDSCRKVVESRKEPKEKIPPAKEAKTEAAPSLEKK